MNFKISSLGEPIALRSPDGFSVADSVFLPSLIQDRSWGRQFDAHPNWVEFFMPTPNASNGANNVTEETSDFILAYPNPVPSGGTIYLRGATDIYDMQGRRRHSFNTGGVRSVDLPAGLYTLVDRTRRASRMSTVKLIVQ